MVSDAQAWLNEFLGKTAAARASGYEKYNAQRTAYLAYKDAGLIDDSEDLMSNSGPHQGLDLTAPPNRPAAPKMEAGQRQLAYLLMQLRQLHLRAEHRLAEGDNVEAVHSELSTGIARLIRSQRRKVTAEAWAAARAAVAAERGPRGYLSGPM